MSEQHTDQLEFDFRTVEPHIVLRSRDEINLELGEFTGPLDLLLYLIRREQANIFDIPVARIADEYLRYIRLMESLDISVAAEFLVMAATLIEIKSKMLLPQEPVAEGEEEFVDPRQALVDQLLEYEKFKRASEMLHERSTVEQAIFGRGRIETDEKNPEVNATVFDLLTVFEKVLERHREEIEIEIQREEMSMAEMLRTVKQRLFSARKLSVTAFFNELKTRHELVLAFISVLEIVRTEGVRLVQKKTFGEIFLKTS